MSIKYTKPAVIFIETPKMAKRYVEELREQGNVEVAMDTEFDSNGVTLMSYSWGKHVRRVVHRDLIKDYYGEWLTDPKSKIVYQNFSADAAEVGEDLGLDLRASFYADTMVTGWLRDETQMKHGLKAQSLTYLKWRRKEYKDLFSYVPEGKKQPIVMTPTQVLYDLPPDALLVRSADEWRETMINYSGDDAESTWMLHAQHKQYLKEIGYWTNYLRIDRPYTLTLMNCEDRGVPLDLPRLEAILRRVEASIMRCEHSFRAAAENPELNINSGPQMKKLLIEEWGWPVREDFVSKKTGEPSLGKEAMTWWHEEHGFDMAKVKLEYNAASTLRGTFLQGLLDGVSEDGRLRSDFNQIGADTGRISSRKKTIKVEIRKALKRGGIKVSYKNKKVGANLQNIPARKEKDPYGIRGAFVSTKKGGLLGNGKIAKEDHVLVVADYSGFELCMAIHWASKVRPDSSMLKIMIKYGSPSACHAFTAIQLYADRKAVIAGKTVRLGDISMDDWRLVKKYFPDEYTISKNNNFNLLYGGAAKMMARLRGMDYNDPKVLRACEKEIQAWNELYDEITDFQRYMIQHGRKYGWVPTISGRRCNVARLIDPTQECLAHGYENCRKCIGHGERKCMNSPCQGSAADIVKVAMNLVDADEELNDLGNLLLFPVHDELVSECPLSVAPRVLARTIELMKKPFRSEMAFEIDVEGKFDVNWQKAKA